LSRISCIVEGDGEVFALPLLLRRLAEWRSNLNWIDIDRPIRVKRDRFLNREEEFRRYLLLADSKSGDDGWILIVLDADDDCPALLGQDILQRAQELVSPTKRISIILANREYEAWFIAAAQSLHGSRGLEIEETDLIADPEIPRNAKGWLGQRMKNKTYGPTTDQPALTQIMNLASAFERSRSFRKLCSEWDRHSEVFF
jgi:hypothetical protein